MPTRSFVNRLLYVAREIWHSIYCSLSCGCLPSSVSRFASFSVSVTWLRSQTIICAWPESPRGKESHESNSI